MRASRTVVLAAAMALVAVIGACDGGDDDANPTLPPRETSAPTAQATDPPDAATTPSTEPATPPPRTTEPPPTTATPTTARSSTTTSTSTTTTAAPPTTAFDEAALEAEIAADLIAAHAAVAPIVGEPSTADLDARIAKVAVGDLAGLLKERVLDLVERGERVVPAMPAYDLMTVDRVDWDPARPDEAFVLVCTVENFQTVSGATPNTITVSGGELTAVRYEQHVVKTDHGWLPDVFQDQSFGTWLGETACPAP